MPPPKGKVMKKHRKRLLVALVGLGGCLPGSGYMSGGHYTCRQMCQAVSFRVFFLVSSRDSCVPQPPSRRTRDRQSRRRIDIFVSPSTGRTRTCRRSCTVSCSRRSHLTLWTIDSETVPVPYSILTQG